jgi:uncharacterized SAM-binding protein YcdF (DUF218 family)
LTIQRGNQQLRRRLLGIAGTIVVAGMIWCCFILFKINGFSNQQNVKKADIGIVLGASLRGDVPSPALKERLDESIRLYREGKFERFIVSGGYDRQDSKYSEAEGMRNYLVKLGIPDERIIIEPKATSTYENLIYSSEIMRTHGWKSSIIVTHRYHAARSGDIADAIGMKSYSVSGLTSKVLFIPWHEVREVLAFTKWYGFKWFGNMKHVTSQI